MKKVISLLILTFIIILPINVKAMNVDKNNLTLEKGQSDTINLSVTVEKEVTEINFTLVYLSNDVKAIYHIASGLMDSTPNSSSHKIVLSESKSGTISLGTAKINVVETPTDKTGTINIYGVNAVTSDGEVITLPSQSIKITIKETTENNTEETVETTTPENKPEENKKTEENKQETTKKEENKKQEETKKTEIKNEEEKQEEIIHYLEKIESEIVNIKLQDNIFEYTVKIKEDIEKLDLKPIVKDDKYQVEISNQVISELTNNQIIITVKNGEKKQEYKINIKVMTIDEIEIDNSEFKSTYTYKNKYIIAIVALSLVLFIGLLLTKKK